MNERGYSSYQGRSQWYIDHWGHPDAVHESIMEDGKVLLGVMAFGPDQTEPERRQYWTFATNGMSERRMPCLSDPHGQPEHRIELLAYSREPASWVAELLMEMARYPYKHSSGLWIGHTMPVNSHEGALWGGYVLTWPRLEPEEFNPLGIDIGLGSDQVFFAQVVGLKRDELELAIEIGGPSFMHDVVGDFATPDPSPIDIDRPSFLGRGHA